jgi:SSS family solute:Na+ symporter
LTLVLALVLYGIAVLSVGIFTARRASLSPESFLVGSREFGTFALWAALSSTTIGGSTTLLLASLVGAYGVSGIWLDLAGASGLALLGFGLARRVRGTNAVTLSEVIGRMYGPVVRKIGACLVILAEIVWFALLTQATETVVTAATDWPPRTVLVVTASLFVSYTLLGGQRAVIGTDLLQFGLMVALLLGVALPLAITSLLQTGLPPQHLSFPFSTNLGPMDIAALFVLVGLPHAVGSDVWAKVLSARDENVARRATLGAAVSKVAFGVGVSTIALAGIALGEMGGVSLFPKTVLLLAGPTLAPLLFVAMIATMQSSSDSVLLSAAAATGYDLLPGVPSPGRIRVLIALLGGLGLLVALALPTLLETFRLGYTIFAAGLILPILAGLVPRLQVPPGYAAWAMVLGGGSAVALHFARIAGIDPVLIGTGVNGLVLVLGFARSRRAGAPPR